MKSKNSSSRPPRSVMVAMVLGGALSATQVRADVSGEPPAQTRVIQDISRYCQACWRNALLPADAWSDCTQEVFTRLLERVEPTEWVDALEQEGDARREFVRAIDAVKKRVQRQRKAASLPPDVPDRHRKNLRPDWEVVEQAADRALTERQRRILELCRDGWSVPEIADELSTTPQRVSDEKYKAVRKLRQELS